MSEMANIFSLQHLRNGVIFENKDAAVLGLSEQSTQDGAISLARYYADSESGTVKTLIGVNYNALGMTDPTNVSASYTIYDADKDAFDELKALVDKINGDENSEGSFKYAIKQAVEALEGSDDLTYDTLKKLEDAIKQEVSDREAAFNNLTASSVADENKIVTDVTQTEGKISATATELTSVKLGGYAEGGDAKIAATDTLGGALGKLQGQINAMDKEASAEAGKVLTTVAQADGKVSETKSAVKDLQLGGYAKGDDAGTIETNDTLNTAFSKLENKIIASTSASTIISSDKSINASPSTAGTDVSVNIKSDEKVLKKDGNNGLYTDIKLSGITEGLEANVREEYALVGGDGTKLGDTVIKVYKDSALLSVALLHASGDTLPSYDKSQQKWTDIADSAQSEANLALCYAYEDVNGELHVVAVLVGSFLRESEFKDGLQVVGGEVSVKKDASSESFLTIGSDGVKISGIQDAINGAVQTASGNVVTEITNKINDLDSSVTGTGATTNITVSVSQKDGKLTELTINDSKVATKESVDTLTGQVESLSGKVDDVEDSVTALSGKVDGVEANVTALSGKAITSISMTGGNASISAASDGTKQAALNVDGSTVKMTSYSKPSGGVVEATDSVNEAVAKLDEAITKKANKTDVYTKDEVDGLIGGITSGDTGTTIMKVNVEMTGGTASATTNATGATIFIDTDASQIKMDGYTSSTGGTITTADTIAQAIAKLQHKTDSINTNGITIFSPSGSVGQLVNGYNYYMDSPNQTIKITADDEYDGTDGKYPKLNVDVDEAKLKLKTINGQTITGEGNITISSTGGTDNLADIDILQGFGGESIWDNSQTSVCVSTSGEPLVMKLTNSDGESRYVSMPGKGMTLTIKSSDYSLYDMVSFTPSYCKEDATEFDPQITGTLTLSGATTTKSGLMSKEDKVKLDNVPTEFATINGQSITNGGNIVISSSGSVVAEDTKVQQKAANTVSTGRYNVILAQTANSTQQETGTVNKAPYMLFDADSKNLTVGDTYPTSKSEGTFALIGTDGLQVGRVDSSGLDEINFKVSEYGVCTSKSFVKNEGTDSQILMADGSVRNISGSGDVLNINAIDIDADMSTYSVVLNYNLRYNGTNGIKVDADSTMIPAATTSKAGVMSIADKAKLDYIPDTLLTPEVSFDSTASAVTLSVGTVELVGGDTDVVYGTISAATSTNAGVMTKDDKIKLDSLEKGVFIIDKKSSTSLIRNENKFYFNSSDNSISFAHDYGLGSEGNLDICDFKVNADALQLKTINGQSIVGDGNIVIDGGGGSTIIQGVGKVDETSNGTGEIFNSYSGSSKNVASGMYSHAEGEGTISRNNSSHAEGAETSAMTDCGHAEGYMTLAEGLYASHAEGTSTSAMSQSSHAEGEETIANGKYSHAEGNGSNASGNGSHAEGGGTTANGRYSHAEGSNTFARNEGEHAEGKYNVSNTGSTNDKQTIHSIGIGVGDTSRKNAVEVMGNGDMYIKGIGMYDGTNYSSSQTLQEVIESFNNNLANVDILQGFGGTSLWNDKTLRSCVSMPSPQQPLVLKLTNSKGESREISIFGNSSSVISITSDDGTLNAQISETEKFGYCKEDRTQFAPASTFSGSIPSATSSKTGLMSKEDKAKLDSLPIPIVIDCSSYTTMSDVLIRGVGGKWRDIVENRCGNLFFIDRNGSIGAFTYFYNSESDEIQGTGQIMATTSRFTDLNNNVNYQVPVLLFYTNSHDSGGIYQNGDVLYEW